MDPTGDNNNIFITQGKDYEGTKGNKFFRSLLAPRAVRYRRAMDEGNREEKDAIAREVREGMEKNGSRLFKKKKGTWVEVTELSTPSLDSSIKEALRSVTKKRKMLIAGPDTYPQDLPSPLQTPQYYSQTCPPPSTPTDCREVQEASNISLSYEVTGPPDLVPSPPQVPQDYSQTCISPSTPTGRREVSEHFNTSPAYDWYGEGEKLTPFGWNNDKTIDVVKQQTLCSPDLRMPLLQAGPFEDFCSNPVCGEAQPPYRRPPKVDSSRQCRNSLYLSQLEESMFNLACSKIHEKELRRNCKPVSYVGVC